MPLSAAVWRRARRAFDAPKGLWHARAETISRVGRRGSKRYRVWDAAARVSRSPSAAAVGVVESPSRDPQASQSPVQSLERVQRVHVRAVRFDEGEQRTIFELRDEYAIQCGRSLVLHGFELGTEDLLR